MNIRWNMSILAAIAATLLLSMPAANADDDALLGADVDLATPIGSVSTDVGLFEDPHYDDDAVLHVRDSEVDGRYRVYRGADYDTIVKNNPDLGANAELEILGAEIGAQAGVETPIRTANDIQASHRTYVRNDAFVYVEGAADAPARLYWIDENNEYAYMGSDFDAIVRAHPDLRDRDGFADFKKRVKTTHQHRMKLRSSSEIEGPRHVELWYQPNGVALRAWTWTDGAWEHQEWTASSEAELRTKLESESPELATWLAADASADASGEPVSMKTQQALGARVAMQPHTVDGREQELVCIMQVQPNSLAARMGLQQGDVILSVNGTDAPTTSELTAEIERATNGSADSEKPVDLVVLRDNARVQLSLSSALMAGGSISD